jgi:hypothetical protein
MRQAFLIVAGIFFALLALVQLTRLYLHFPVIIDNAPMPLWTNAIGFVVASLLSLWMFYSAKRA